VSTVAAAIHSPESCQSTPDPPVPSAGELMQLHLLPPSTEISQRQQDLFVLLSSADGAGSHRWPQVDCQLFVSLDLAGAVATVGSATGVAEY